jgi:hypothetical protein
MQNIIPQPNKRFQSKTQDKIIPTQIKSKTNLELLQKVDSLKKQLTKK